VSVPINTCREEKKTNKESKVDILDYSEKKERKTQKREEEIMAVVLSMVVVVREVDASMEHKNVILVRLRQTLD